MCLLIGYSAAKWRGRRFLRHNNKTSIPGSGCFVAHWLLFESLLLLWSDLGTDTRVIQERTAQSDGRRGRRIKTPPHTAKNDQANSSAKNQKKGERLAGCLTDRMGDCWIVCIWLGGFEMRQTTL